MRGKGERGKGLVEEKIVYFCSTNKGFLITRVSRLLLRAFDVIRFFLLPVDN